MALACGSKEEIILNLIPRASAAGLPSVPRLRRFQICPPRAYIARLPFDEIEGRIGSSGEVVSTVRGGGWVTAFLPPDHPMRLDFLRVIRITFVKSASGFGVAFWF